MWTNNGSVPTKTNGVRIKAYEIWRHMIARCGYLDGVSEPNYEDVTVNDDWLEYSNFYHDITTLKGYDTKRFVLDKDLLVKGNTEYRKDVVCFLPYEINNFLTDSRKTRGVYLIGVDFHKKTGKFRARCRKHLGLFDTEVEAFNVYKVAKEALAKELALKYKDEIDIRAYQALLNYEVNTED